MMHTFTIAEAARKMAARQLSSVELTQICLRRIEQIDPELHCFLSVTEDRARADAEASDDRRARGESRGVLDGIPIAHKDIYNTAGIRTTAQSRLLQDNMPNCDATTVRMLSDAGTVLLGKLATHEFALGGPSFDLPWPPVRNPWNTERFTTGSSSGTAAAIAAGLVLGGTGSDTGGSIRGPAALCGIAGIKPTRGLVSSAGIFPLASTLDHAGPMAWTVEDCALLLQAMAGYDPADPASCNGVVPNFTAELGKGIAGLRVGIIRHFHETDLVASSATIAGIDAAAEIFRDRGAIVSDVTLSPLMEYHACGFLILLAEAYAAHEHWLTSRFDEYGVIFRDRVALGGLVRAADYIRAQDRRRSLREKMATAMDDVDVVITAVEPAEAQLITEVPKWGLLDKPSYTIPFNVTGYPAMSVCSGYGESGLPIALQIAAKPFCEPLLLRVAHAYETSTDWRERRPSTTPPRSNDH